MLVEADRDVDRIHLHGALSEHLDAGGDHRAGERGWSLRGWDASGPHAHVEVAVTSDNSPRALVDRLSGQSLPLGPDARRGGPRVARWVLGQPALVAAATWEELATPTPWTSCRVAFTEPTTFRSGDRYRPLPLPSRIVSSLLPTWRAFAGDVPLWIPDLSMPDTWVLGTGDVRLHLVRVPDKRARDKSVGREPKQAPAWTCVVDYVSDSWQEATVFTSVLRLAELVGLGARRAFGLGRIRIVETH